MVPDIVNSEPICAMLMNAIAMFVRFCSSDGVRQLLGNASTIAYEDAVTVDPRCCRNQSNKKATKFPILRSDGKFGE
jgi:hypothetical protein